MEFGLNDGGGMNFFQTLEMCELSLGAFYSNMVLVRHCILRDGRQLTHVNVTELCDGVLAGMTVCWLVCVWS